MSCLFILMQDIRHCLFIPARPVIQSAAYAGSFGKSLEHTITERQNACSARTLQGSHLERGHGLVWGGTATWRSELRFGS